MRQLLLDTTISVFYHYGESEPQVSQPCSPQLSVIADNNQPRVLKMTARSW